MNRGLDSLINVARVGVCNTPTRGAHASPTAHFSFDTAKGTMGAMGLRIGFNNRTTIVKWFAPLNSQTKLEPSPERNGPNDGDPFSLITSWNGFWIRGWNVKEDKDTLYIRIDMPFVDKDNVKITVDQNTLIVKGEGEKESEEDEHGRI
ncbi:unnamed protein product [Ilex paraguariensis]|uniref:SHSP domain-containing protein n=1 Tax=Ilex paraguariensis TaxID=185542 RepID=A0ABC8UGB2_9AQUA